MGHEKTFSRKAVQAVLVCVLALFCLALLATPAWATDEHTFDPTLSLTGNCSTSAEDSVADPGCPGGSHPFREVFDGPAGTAVDSYGDIYVGSPGTSPKGVKEGAIYVFNSSGEYLTEVKDSEQALSMAVDPEGNLYALNQNSQEAILYAPESYPPAAGTVYTPILSLGEERNPGSGNKPQSVAVDPSNGHVYVAYLESIEEFDSAANGSGMIDGEIGEGLGEGYYAVGVWGANHDVYATGRKAGSEVKTENDRVLIFDGEDGHLKVEIDGSDEDALKIDKTPGNDFGFGATGIAVDQANGDVYVGDVPKFGAVHQFRANGEFVTEIKHSLVNPQPVGIAVDDPCLDLAEEPCAGAPVYESPNEGDVFVTSGNGPSNSHLFAFEPPLFEAPEIQSQAAASITETEAVLRAEVNPNALATAYRFQYTTQADFEEDEYADATTVPVPDGDAGSGGFFAAVSKQIGGLAPGTAYRFRIVAGNEEGEAEAEAGFSTYRPETGLADGRAYELVTPPDTNGRVPTMQEMSHNSNGNAFDTPLASPDGESVVFGVEGGSLPGMEGGGLHDTYEARRTSTGWQSHFTGVPGTLAPEVYVGGISPDHGYSFWTVADDPAGQLLTPGQYLRKPDGSFEALSGEGRWITTNGAHVISVSSNHLTEDAPPAPMSAVYDRGGGTIRLVSLLPGNVTPGFGENADYIATSADGSAVAFKIGATMYLRLDGEETLEVATGNTVYGGLSADGARLFYLRPNPTEPLFNGSEVSQGEIFAYDVASEATTAIGSGEEAILVNVSADGSHSYFTSPEQLDGAKGEAGAQNLYLWDGSAVRFLATLTERDLVGEPGFGCNNCDADGLGLWVNGPAASYAKGSAQGPGEDPSRSTPEGSVLLFESRANLSPYDSEGHAEVYRYDASSEETLCLSCNPTGAAAQSNAELQSVPGGQLAHFRPVNALSVIPNLSADGKKAFFQSADRLVPGDVDGKIDVYEWEAYGEGGCELEGGCLHLVSSGRSAGDDYLYAATPDGSDVFFESGDLLVPQDPDATPSIYDARVGGGFPPPSPPPGECLGEACQPALAAPEDPTPASAGFEGSGNVEEAAAAPKPACAKGKHRVKGRCTARHSKKKQHRRHRAHRNRRAGR